MATSRSDRRNIVLVLGDTWDNVMESISTVGQDLARFIATLGVANVYCIVEMADEKHKRDALDLGIQLCEFKSNIIHGNIGTIKNHIHEIDTLIGFLPNTHDMFNALRVGMNTRRIIVIHCDIIHDTGKLQFDDAITMCLGPHIARSIDPSVKASYHTTVIPPLADNILVNITESDAQRYNFVFPLVIQDTSTQYLNRHGINLGLSAISQFANNKHIEPKITLFLDTIQDYNTKEIVRFAKKCGVKHVDFKSILSIAEWTCEIRQAGLALCTSGKAPFNHWVYKIIEANCPFLIASTSGMGQLLYKTHPFALVNTAPGDQCNVSNINLWSHAIENILADMDSSQINFCHGHGEFNRIHWNGFIPVLSHIFHVRDIRLRSIGNRHETFENSEKIRKQFKKLTSVVRGMDLIELSKSSIKQKCESQEPLAIDDLETEKQMIRLYREFKKLGQTIIRVDQGSLVFKVMSHSPGDNKLLEEMYNDGRLLKLVRRYCVDQNLAFATFALDLTDELAEVCDSMSGQNISSALNEKVVKDVIMAQNCAGCEEARLTEEAINDLEDLIDGMELLELHGLDQSEITSIDDVQRRLHKHLASAQVNTDDYGGSGETCARINADKIKHLIVAQRDGCQMMLSVIQKMKDFVNGLPEGKIRKDLETAFPDAEERIQQAAESLGKYEFSILVAGDTGAGKSSFINLLLGESSSDTTNILPVAHTSSTSAICEIRYKEEPALEIKESESQGFRNIPLPDGEEALHVISKYAYQRRRCDEEFTSEIVRIYWPVMWLKNNVVIVDSPGVAENDRLTKLVKEYIPKASGFIYVINPAIDGGFAPDKLQDLLFTHVEKQDTFDKSKYNFEHRAAIFVCNKWDDIKKGEKKEMKEHIEKNLHDIWPLFGPDQLFYFSTKQAVASLKDKYTPEDYKNLLLGLERLLPIACQNRLAKEYWSLADIIKRINYTLTLDLKRQNANHKKEESKYIKIEDDLDRILRNQAQITSDLHDMAQQEVKTALFKLKNYMVLMWDELLEWDERDCPKVPRRKQELFFALEHAAHKRIKTCIEEWALTNNIFGEIAEKISNRFNSEFYALRSELDFIENYRLEPGNIKLEYIPSYLNYNSYGFGHSLTSAHLAFTYGFAALFNSKHIDFNGARVKEYNSNKAISMKDMTRLLLSRLLDETEQLKAIFDDTIKELHKSINNLLSHLPNIIKANRLLDQKIFKAVSTGSAGNAEIYKGMYGTGFDLENEINTIYLNHIKTYDIKLDELEPVNWKPVGKGHFSVVYAANHKGKQVAIKKTNGPACGSISTNFILEETNFRNLKMPNIVQFYGTAVQREENGVYPLLVLEYCQCSLADIVLRQDKYRAPGRICDQDERENGGVYKTAALYGMDISSALKSLHNLGYVHRDLKLENILVDAEGRLKLADLGLCKLEADITGSHVGTPIYMAPEVQRSNIYNHSADIFSLGMVIWELWYGICVVTKYHLSNLEEFKEDCFTEYAPPKPWMGLILNCLKREPNARPTAEEAFRFFCSTSKPTNEEDKFVNTKM